MPEFVVALVVVFAVAGHVLLFAAAVNRLQALGRGELFDHVATLAHWSLLPLVPLALLVTERPWRADFASEVLGGTFCAGWTTYGLICLCTFGVTACDRLVRAFRRDGAGPGSSETIAVELPDASAEPDRRGHPLARLARLPLNEARTFEVRTIRVTPARPVGPFDGFRIAHLGDLHLTGDIGFDFFRRVIAVVRDGRPDLVVISGDLVDRDEVIDRFAELFGPLAAPEGVAFVLGNHDGRHRPDELRRRLIEAGWRHLGGEALELKRDGRTLTVAGDERPWFGDGPGEAAGDLRVLVSHTPDNFDAASRAGYDLVLSGHNHGGQVRLPGLGALYSPSLTGTRYASGLFRRGGTTLHVTRGVSALVPVRYRCRPEVAFLDLVSDS